MCWKSRAPSLGMEAQREPRACAHVQGPPHGAGGSTNAPPPGSQKPPWSSVPIPHHGFPALVLGTTMGWGIAPGGTLNVLLKPCCASANFSFLS